MSSSGTDGYIWSEWQWDGSRNKYCRYRYNSKKKQVWQSREPESTPRVPVPTPSSAIQQFSSSAVDNNPGYDSGGRNYAFNSQGQMQSSDSVGDIAQTMANTSLTDEYGTAGSYVDSSGSGQSSSGYQASVPQYQAAQYQTRPSYKPQPQVPMYSPDGRGRSYTGSTGGGFASSAPIGYDPAPPSSNYYNPRGQQETSYNYEGEDTVDARPYDQQGYANPSSSTSGGDMTGRSYDTDATVTPEKHRRSRRSTTSTREPPPLRELASGQSAPKQPPPLQPSTDLMKLPTRRNITGTEGKSEPLDPEFIIHPSKFFKPGQIFKVVWSEPEGETRSDTVSVSGRTDVTVESWTADAAYGERVYSSVRRFVVVATGKGFSNCVPILTYGGKGLRKSGMPPEYQAAIHSAAEPPQPIYKEQRRSIKFIGKNARHKLDSSSVINYAKIYPVEHNVKVQFIGWIAPDSQRHFVTDFDKVWDTLRRM